MSTSIFNISSSSSVRSPKTHFTHAEIPLKYLDPSQPPTKGVPFRQIRNVPFVRDVQVCMPERLWQQLYGEVTENGVPKGEMRLPVGLSYAKANMTFKDLLDNEDLRRGDYLLLSAPRSPSSGSTSISIDCGKLIIDMPQHIYQRSGLTFPTSRIPSGGQKHDMKSARHRIVMDLRQPSMVKGKKGLDRLMYAAKTVEGLCEPRVWLFYDLSDTHAPNVPASKSKKCVIEHRRSLLQGSKGQPVGTVEVSTRARADSEGEDKHPLSQFTSTITSTTGETSTFAEVLVPSFLSSPNFFSTLRTTAANTQSQRASLPTVIEDDIYDITEYLSLLFLQSPRITKAEYGQIDSYLCQYVLPDTSSHLVNHESNDDHPDEPQDNPNAAKVEDLRTISYSGFTHSTFVTQLLIDIIRRSRSTKQPLTMPNTWVALSITAYQTDVQGGTDGFMILLQADSVADQSSTDAINEETGADTMMIEGQSEKEKAGQEDAENKIVTGFRYVTCFEFVDNVVG